LWRLFWLQSMNTFPPLASFFMVEVMRSPWWRSRAWATVWANDEARSWVRAWPFTGR
jgi:hypothetical protein